MRMGTVAVAGSWELGYSAPLTERDLWAYPLRDYHVDAWYMAPISGIQEQRLTEVPDIEPLILETPLTRVFVDENAGTELGDFEHPTDALYILGKASFSPFAAYATPDDLSVRIATPAAAGMLWPHQALLLVLHDRWVKSWR